MQESDLILDYAPRRQFVPFHQRSERFACIVTHRRAGKTVACIQDLQRGATSCENLCPRFAYLAPFLKQSKAVAWEGRRAGRGDPEPDQEARSLWLPQGCGRAVAGAPCGPIGESRWWFRRKPGHSRRLFLDRGSLGRYSQADVHFTPARDRTADITAGPGWANLGLHPIERSSKMNLRLHWNRQS
jgi:hypothetical protein